MSPTNVEASHLRERYKQEKNVADQLRKAINEILIALDVPTNNPATTIETIREVLSHYKIP